MVRRVAMVVAMVLLASGCYKAFDFDTDGKADIVSVNNGVWRDLTKPADPPMHVGSGTDLAAPGDYDGNGRYDVAAIDTAGNWVTKSGLGTVNFPMPTQLPAYTGISWRYPIVPVPADYDGDGKADPAWYRDTDGTWFIDGKTPIQFGNGPTTAVAGPGVPGNAIIDQDFPTPADYDGDGKADLSTYNPRTRVWRVKSSRDGTISSVTMPGSNRTLRFAVPADYDGVKHAQRALFGSDGWTIEGHADPILFGNDVPGAPIGTGDASYPAVADYDGDGKADLTYVDTFGVWHTRSSADPLAITPTYSVGPLGSATGPYALEFGVASLYDLARFTLVAKNCAPVPVGFPSDC